MITTYVLHISILSPKLRIRNLNKKLLLWVSCAPERRILDANLWMMVGLKNECTPKSEKGFSVCLCYLIISEGLFLFSCIVKTQDIFFQYSCFCSCFLHIIIALMFLDIPWFSVIWFLHNYSRVHISSDEAFFKILKKPSIVQK